MANATPVHSKKKPLSKDAENIKKELDERTNAGDNVDVPTVPAGKSELADGTIREDN